MIEKYLFGSGNTDIALLVARIWTGAMMVYHGSIKLFGGMERFLETVTQRLHLPAWMGWAAALIELLGGACLTIGILTRPAAMAVAIVMAVAAFGAHATDPWSRKEFALCYFVFCCVLLAAGAGSYSIDAILLRKQQHSQSNRLG
ncbi:MAG: DoxX family protein [Bacteroidota bacterium]|nr:DoxX family protein [Candidatus Kapabacteria bacterium]MCX7937668.1 DoxX family protein [Chlorobiota bacterium]MDW8075802.1 DoxX family protein [Bacteroidota bacterium]MDW8272251.1 DoxX family protein [Bacteroidota bacterium]